ncbi:FAD-dependent oxidoreductase [Aldersonia sp. NBC_00410]|uniref:FAD-dependent oxidoreductase n=1 Tax=Aldersonia sp. NBC_00410 TaxID=2975954 RepID=UPI002254585D|nr:FAD-dependent oxidoreductase [Aldersonia sp. NBC_00410]MCX5041712.1 FAD-dependent oxidoreductase [Aldersonia sp. NBC_00410]
MTQVAIIGAGPYGLSIAAHLRAFGVDHRIFGPAMDTWRHHVPAGMLLKSDGFASNLSEPSGAGTLAAYCAEHSVAYHPTELPVRLDVFNEYATDFQRRFVPQLEDRQVVSVERSAGRFLVGLDDGETFTADTVVAAVGISHFAVLPEELMGLPGNLASHSSAHSGLSQFSGQRIAVVGAGASAVDIATLMAEAGAAVSLVTRRDRIKFASAPAVGPRGRGERLKAPATGIGPGWRSWACQNLPGLFRVLPGKARLKIVKRHLGPSSAFAMKARFEDAVTTFLGVHIDSAYEEDGQVCLVLRCADGSRRELRVDHVVSATGYRPDVARLPFLSDGLRRELRTHENMPMVSRFSESSVPGFYFVGPPAVDSFGPLMRFMVGAEYIAPLVARRLRKVTSGREPVRAATNA